MKNSEFSFVYWELIANYKDDVSSPLFIVFEDNVVLWMMQWKS